MSEFTFETANGNGLADSAFTCYAKELLDKECRRLCDFTAGLDKDPGEKKERISEYKCAKYRYASVAHIYNLVNHGNRVYRLSATPIDIENCIKNNNELFKLCNDAAEDERIDYKLYYGISFLANEKLKYFEDGTENANDWEKIELGERMDGLTYAMECLKEAWEKRKDVVL